MLSDRIEKLLTDYPPPWRYNPAFFGPDCNDFICDKNGSFIELPDIVFAINGDCYSETEEDKK